jgi:glucose-1-phosphate thymidylyltransferase
MKGVILAGGSGTRLYPCTKVTNKHLLPVYNKPMIFYPIQTLLAGGIREILIVSGPGHAGHFLNLLGSGKDFRAKFTYEIQDEAGGIAQALRLAEDFAGGDDIVVILGDNIFEDKFDFSGFSGGAKIFLKKMPLESAKRFGVAQTRNGSVVSIEEKPKNPKSNYVVTGLYMYDSSVFETIRKLKPSQRGELEITDVNNHYVKKGKMAFSFVKGRWSDAGTFPSLFRASEIMKDVEEGKV